MNVRPVLSLLAALLALAAMPHALLAQQLPPGPTTRYQSSVELTNQPGTFDLIQLVLDFAPGAWTPQHSHGGPGLVTVLEGEMAVRERGAERHYDTGDMWLELPREVAAVGNPATLRATIAVSFVLPKGAPLTVVQPAAAETALPRTGGAGQSLLWLSLWLLAASGVAAGWLVRRAGRRVRGIANDELRIAPARGGDARKQ